MSVFDFFRSKKKNSIESSEASIEFGFRAEGITYRLSNNSTELWFTWVNGARIYTETINKWKNDSLLTRNEKERVFNEVVKFVEQKAEKPIIVISADDPSKDLWEQLCSANQLLIKDIEYTSSEKQYQQERNMYLGIIKAGKKLVLDETEISNEKEIDEAMQKRRKKTAA